MEESLLRLLAIIMCLHEHWIEPYLWAGYPLPSWKECHSSVTEELCQSHVALRGNLTLLTTSWPFMPGGTRLLRCGKPIRAIVPSGRLGRWCRCSLEGFRFFRMANLRLVGEKGVHNHFKGSASAAKTGFKAMRPNGNSRIAHTVLGISESRIIF